MLPSKALTMVTATLHTNTRSTNSKENVAIPTRENSSPQVRKKKNAHRATQCQPDQRMQHKQQADKLNLSLSKQKGKQQTTKLFKQTANKCLSYPTKQTKSTVLSLEQTRWHTQAKQLTQVKQNSNKMRRAHNQSTKSQTKTTPTLPMRRSSNRAKDPGRAPICHNLALGRDKDGTRNGLTIK